MKKQRFVIRNIAASRDQPREVMDTVESMALPAKITLIVALGLIFFLAIKYGQNLSFFVDRPPEVIAAPASSSPNP